VVARANDRQVSRVGWSDGIPREYREFVAVVEGALKRDLPLEVGVRVTLLGLAVSAILRSDDFAAGTSESSFRRGESGRPGYGLDK
jgi:hypothetical protein